MVILVRVIGIIIVMMGIIILLNPKTFNQLMNFFKVGRRLYWNGFLRLLFGIVLLLGASQCRRVVVVIAMGILFLLGGVAIFALGLEKLKIYN